MSTKAISWLICVVGIGAILSALPTHWPTSFNSGLAHLLFGVTQGLGTLYGAGILAVGIRLSRSFANSDGTAVRLKAALYIAVWSILFSIICVIWPKQYAEWVLLGYVAALCVLLPLELGLLTLVGVGGLHVLLTWVSGVKTGLTGLPLTVLDLKIALANPSALWDALGLPHWTRHLAIAFLGIVLLGWMLVGVVAVGRYLMRRPWTNFGRSIPQVVSVAVIGVMTFFHLEILYANAAKDESTWHPERLSLLARRMGVLPFLSYSYRLESKSTGDIYQVTGNYSPPSAEEVRAAVLNYIDFSSTGESKARLFPNILVVLAESTFDPGAVFRLEGEWNDRLFRRGQQTIASGLLRVNTVGGGTWISEFETIVGLDSRIFGFSGMYTHASLSPYVNGSLATYLRDRGYRTLAFFPNRGDFYNARNAYERYGFQKIFDSKDLGIGAWVEDDLAIAAGVKKSMGPRPDSPFFGYVLFLENHSPHDCRATDTSVFSVRFVDTSDFVLNCALHEYLRRLGSTTAATESLVTYLEQIEARTGRPFVLMVFGDHQPFTFTGTDDSGYDFRAVRSHPDNTYTTFFNILSSSPVRRLRCCSVAPPAAVLPTLLSAFVATSPDDVYLGINLWLFAHCDSDAVRRDFGPSMEALSRQPHDGRTDNCKRAYNRALAGYRASGIMSLGDEQ